MSKPGSSYRLGVRHPFEADADDAKLQEAFFASIATQLRSTQRKPAVVRVSRLKRRWCVTSCLAASFIPCFLVDIDLSFS